MLKIRAKDLIAALTILSIVFLKWSGNDGSLDAVLALILGYYFVKRQNGLDNGE